MASLVKEFLGVGLSTMNRVYQVEPDPAQTGLHVAAFFSVFIAKFLKDFQKCYLRLWIVVEVVSDPRDCSPPGPSVHVARTLKLVAIFSFRESSQPRDQIHVSYISCIGGQALHHWQHLGSPWDCGYNRIKEMAIHCFSFSLCWSDSSPSTPALFHM